jgi:hypothetical protein
MDTGCESRTTCFCQLYTSRDLCRAGRIKLANLPNPILVMIEEFQEKQRQQRSRMRSTIDYVMGTFFFLLGVYFLVYEKLGFP